MLRRLPRIALLSAALVAVTVSCPLPGGGTEAPKDNMAPSVTVSSTAVDPAGSSPIDVSIVFSETVNGFDSSDLTVIHATVGNFASVDGSTFTVDLTPDASEVTVTLDIHAGVCTDTAGNPNSALGAAFSRFYTERPTVIITSTTAAITNVSPIPVTITFNKSVENFASSDASLTNCSISGFSTTDDTVWTAALTPSGQGTVSATVLAGVCNRKGAPAVLNVASAAFSRQYDSQRPGVSLSSTAPEPTTASPIPITITFTEAVTGFQAGDITVSGGSVGNLQTLNNVDFTAEVTPGGRGRSRWMLQTGVCQDAAGNTNTAASSSVSRTFQGPSPGSLDSGFATGSAANNWVYAIGVQSDGKVVIGGNFTTCDGASQKYIARLNTDGGLDTGFTTALNGGICALAIQPDDKIIIAGWFTSCDGASRYRLARLNANGTNDSSFTNGFGADNDVEAIALQSDGNMVIGGYFTSYVVSRGRVARALSGGGVDATFTNTPGGADATVWAVGVQSDGKVLIGGDFANYNGTTVSCLARLNTDGSLDTSFGGGSAPNGSVYSILVLSDDSILIGGSFTAYGVPTRGRIARLSSSGTLDTSFATGAAANYPVRAIARQGDGKILIGGDFSTYDGSNRGHVARLKTDGSLDTGFLAVGSGTSDYVLSIALQSDGKILIGGRFTSYSSTTRGHIAQAVELKGRGILVITEGVFGMKGNLAKLPEICGLMASTSRSTSVGATHRLLECIRHFDEACGWHEQGAVSCAHWLAWRLGWDPATAREKVGVARALGTLPAIDEALRSASTLADLRREAWSNWSWCLSPTRRI